MLVPFTRRKSSSATPLVATKTFPFDMPVANPKVVLAAAASASSIKEAPNVLIVLVSTLSELRFVKFASTSLLVRG